MKALFFLTAFALSSVSLAAASCPSGMLKVRTCVSTPQTGDQEVAANIFDSITVCNQGAKTVLVPEKKGQAETADATVVTRMGGTDYVIETPDVDFTLSVTTGIRGKTSPAKLSINFKSAKLLAKSTYTCTK